MKRTTAGWATIAALLVSGLSSPMSGAAATTAAPQDTGERRALAQERASKALDRHRGAFRAASKDTFTEAGTPVLDRDGGAHVRFERRYAGLPVLGGDTVAHLDATGNLESTSLSLRQTLSVGTTGKVGRAVALRTALAAYDGTRDSVTARRVVDAVEGPPVLAWEVEIHGMRADQTPSRFHAVVDASTGALRRSYDEIAHATGTGTGVYAGAVSFDTTQTGSTYSLSAGTANGSGVTTDLNGSTSATAAGTPFTDPDNVWGSNGATSDRASAAVDAHYGAQATYLYFKSAHGRNGIFGDGRSVRSRVHYGTNYNNAFWDGTQMTYGDGSGNARPLVSLDVAGHEMTHGVTERTANLTYSGESGGLNEATSDIFGTLVEFSAGNPADVGDYLIGEKININGNGTPLRYMDRPSRDGGSKDCWSPTLKNVDVHYSSGPANHMFYLLAEGSGDKTINGVSYSSATCDGSTVGGIGRAFAAKIWYRALTTYMTSATSYAGARQAAVNAAKDLYGATSTQCAGVEKAFSAISVPGATCGTTPPTTPPTTTPPTTGSLLQNPGFESGATAWTQTAGVVSNDATKARTGSWLAWLNGYGRTYTDSVAQTVAVPATGASSLSLWLRVTSSETTAATAYDTLKVQVVSGSSTTTLATYSNLDKSTSYAQRTFSLAAYAGRTVTIKLVGAEDSSAATSFHVDDVVVVTS
jgi:Zn-dependent metalloprotease